MTKPLLPPPRKLTPAEIGRRIKARRIKRGLSQKQLAQACGLSQNSVGKIELGRTENSRFIAQIWAYLGLDLAELSDVFHGNVEGIDVEWSTNNQIEAQLLRKTHLLKSITYEVAKFHGESGRGILITWTARNGATISSLMDRPMILDTCPEFFRCVRELGIDLATPGASHARKKTRSKPRS